MLELDEAHLGTCLCEFWVNCPFDSTTQYLQMSQGFESSEGVLWESLDVIILYEPEERRSQCHSLVAAAFSSVTEHLLGLQTEMNWSRFYFLFDTVSVFIKKSEEFTVSCLWLIENVTLSVAACCQGLVSIIWSCPVFVWPIDSRGHTACADSLRVQGY